MMEQGRGDYGSNKTGGWLKDIFKKKEGREDDAATGRTGTDEGEESRLVVPEKLMQLAAIGEEDEKEETKEQEKEANGAVVALEEEDEAAQNNENADHEIMAARQGEIKSETEVNDETETVTHDNGTVYKEEQEEEIEKKSMMSVFGRFMKKINTEPEDIVQPPSYSEVVNHREIKTLEAANKDAEEEEDPVEERRNVSTQVDAETQVEENDIIKMENEPTEDEPTEDEQTEDEPTEDALPESDRITENGETKEMHEEIITDRKEIQEPEQKFRFRFQQFFSDKK